MRFIANSLSSLSTKSLLRNPIKLFNKYFEENSTCPNCLSKEITKEFSICKWIIAGETFIIKSFNPFKTIKIESNALSTWYACDISYNEPCIQCHMSQDEIEIPPPKGSYFCENCGFFIFMGKEQVFLISTRLENRENY